MKYFNILIVVFVVFVGCKREEKSSDPQPEAIVETNFREFGNQFDPMGAWNSAYMFGEYQKITNRDTVFAKFSAKVTEVCQSKGCWMKLNMGHDREVMVKFKDYGFFMPKDIVGKEVVVNGLAYAEEMSVADQRHFAEDGGRSKEEINKIIDPKKTYSFLADGVLLKE